MITLVDIKKSVNDVLAITGMKTYGSEIKEGYKRPSFFVQIIPVTSDTFKKETSENSLIVEMVYYSANKTDLENLQMYDILRKNFGSSLKIGIRNILIRKFRAETIDDIDNIYSIKFNLNFYDEIEDDTPVTDMMQELNLNLNSRRQ